MGSKVKITTTINKTVLEQIAANGIEKALASPEGLEGKCPCCGASIALHAPETTCPSCGLTFTPRVSHRP